MAYRRERHSRLPKPGSERCCATSGSVPVRTDKLQIKEKSMAGTQIGCPGEWTPCVAAQQTLGAGRWADRPPSSIRPTPIKKLCHQPHLCYRAVTIHHSGFRTMVSSDNQAYSSCWWLQDHIEFSFGGRVHACCYNYVNAD